MAKIITAIIMTICLSHSANSQNKKILHVTDVGKITIDKELEMPLVRGCIAGIKTNVLLNTTSYPTILTADLAKKLGLKKKRTSTAGIDIFNSRKLKLVMCQVAAPLNYGAILTKEDKYFKKTNIGAIFNPHVLRCKNCLSVLDFINKKAYIAHIDHSVALPTALDRTYPNLRRTSSTYIGDGTDSLYISGVSVNRKKIGITLLNTAATVSSFSKLAVGKQLTITQQSSLGDGMGKQFKTETTSPVSIEISGTEIAKTPVWLRKEKKMHPSISIGAPEEPLAFHHGEIGMDVMKNCVIAIEYQKAVHFYCKPLPAPD